MEKANKNGTMGSSTYSDIDIENINLLDIMELDFLQEFQDGFANAMGFSSITVDKNSQFVTKPVNFSDFCMKLTKSCPEGARRCTMSDAKGAEESARTGKAAVYYCENGLVDFAAPIMIHGKKIGAMLGGQVLTSPPDLEKYRKIALEIGVDPDEYVEAVKKIQIVPEAQVKSAANLLHLVAGQISKIGLQRMMLMRMSSTIHESLLHIISTTQELSASALDVSTNQNRLNDEIQNVSDASEQINDIIEFIKEIAGETKLLGLNASIEAAKAGEAGLGFGVVAEEIRKLSGESKDTVSKIKQFTEKIQTNVKNTVEMGNTTLETSKQQAEATQQIMASIQELASLAEQLNNLASEK